MPAQRQFAPAVPTPEPGDRGARRFGSLTPRARRVMAWVVRCAERSAERRALAEFGDWQLRDIGISRAEAGTEAAKWFWQS